MRIQHKTLADKCIRVMKYWIVSNIGIYNKDFCRRARDWRCTKIEDLRKYKPILIGSMKKNYEEMSK